MVAETENEAWSVTHSADNKISTRSCHFCTHQSHFQSHDFLWLQWLKTWSTAPQAPPKLQVYSKVRCIRIAHAVWRRKMKPLKLASSWMSHQHSGMRVHTRSCTRRKTVTHTHKQNLTRLCAGEPCESTQRSANTTTKAKRLNQVQSQRTWNKQQNQIQHSHNKGQSLHKYCMAMGSGQACISQQKTTGPLLSMWDIQLNRQFTQKQGSFCFVAVFQVQFHSHFHS